MALDPFAPRKPLLLCIIYWAAALEAVIGWPLSAQGLSKDFWPIGTALAIVAIGIAFRYGATLQADTERLQQQNRALQRDTEGLA